MHTNENLKTARRPGEPQTLALATPSANDGYYYSGQKDEQERALRADLQESRDLDRSIVIHAQLAMLLRGQKRWREARRELRLDDRELSRSSADAKAFVHAAKGSLLLEEGRLSPAAEKLEAAFRHFRHSRDHLQLRQYVSSLWKFAELQAAGGHARAAIVGLLRARSVAEEIGDLHGYCNTRIAEAHIAVSQDDFKSAVIALIWASHPPTGLGKQQPHPRFIAGELARAWAVVEWKHRLRTGRWLGYVHPLWALKFGSQRLRKTMSFVMRVPFLETLAIASPDEVYSALLRHEEMPPLGKGSRPGFSEGERERIFSFFGGLCVLCGRQIKENEKWEVDHIVLHSMGHAPKRTAREVYLNYRPLHDDCNRERGDDDFSYFSSAYHNNPTVWVERAWRRIIET